MENKLDRRLTGMLGFAMRAGKVIIGTEQVCSSLGRNARLVLISGTASDGTRNKILHKCEFYGVDVRVVDMTAAELGRLLGKLYAPAAVAITDRRFAEEIYRAIDAAHHPDSE